MDIALIVAGAGAALLVIARLLGGEDPITRHAYNRTYSDSPGAHTDR